MTHYELNAKDKLIVWLIHFLLQIFAMTWRYRCKSDENIVRASSASTSGAYGLALWHENILASLAVMRGSRMAPLASLSKDGAIVTAVMEKMHFRTIRGSSSKGGSNARDELVAMAAEGYLPTLTVDGPRGPRRIAKTGIIDVARRTGVAIVPFSAVANRSWVLRKSWDHFQIPKPFATIHVVYGAPISVSPEVRGIAFGKVRGQIQAGLVKAQADAEALAAQ